MAKSTLSLFVVHTLATSRDKVPSSMRKMCGITSSCTCPKSDLGICFPLIHSVVYNDSVCRQGRTRSDCANAQVDLGLRCPYMPEDTFSHGMAQMCMDKHM